MRKEDSAFVYHILESYDGLASPTTLDHRTGEAHRDVELWYPKSREDELQAFIKSLGEMVYEIPTSK